MVTHFHNMNFNVDIASGIWLYLNNYFNRKEYSKIFDCNIKLNINIRFTQRVPFALKQNSWLKMSVRCFDTDYHLLV